jgi:hypothetical protein
MYFLINELSISGQFIDKHEASICMDVIKSILQELKPLQNLKLITHQSLSEREFFPGYKVSDWLKDYYSSQDKDRDFLVLIIGLLKETCISKRLDEELENGLYYWECYFNEENYFDSSLAGAAYFEGRLVSVQKSEFFNSSPVTVRFNKNNNEPKIIDILNIFEASHAHRLRPKFCYHSKHDSLGHWDGATPMDLNNDEAQEALDQSLLHEGHTQRYTFFNGKYYIFQDDNAGGYHGYPIDENKVPNSVLKHLENL